MPPLISKLPFSSISLAALRASSECNTLFSLSSPSSSFPTLKLSSSSSTSTRSMTMTPESKTSSLPRRRFLPLGATTSEKNEENGLGAGKRRLKGVVFDVDGTLCEPQNYMFGQMRSALAIPKSTDILEHIHSLPTSSQDAAMSKIRAIESEAMTSQKPQPGLAILMSYLDTKSIPKGICTRNFQTPVDHLLGKFLPGSLFEPIVTREFRPPKPSPEGILHIARSWGLKDGGRSLIMVGDSIDDMTAGYRAGAATVLLVNEENAHLAEHEYTDLVISRLDELVDVLENGFEGRIGRVEEEGNPSS